MAELLVLFTYEKKIRENGRLPRRKGRKIRKGGRLEKISIKVDVEGGRRGNWKRWNGKIGKNMKNCDKGNWKRELWPMKLRKIKRRTNLKKKGEGEKFRG